MGALLMGVSTVANAQDGTKADVTAVENIIKSKPADLANQMKPYFKKNKKNAENLVEFGRAFYAAEDYENAKEYANHALNAKKGFAPAYVLLGDVAAVDEENGGVAAQNYEQAIYWDPKNVEAYRKYANVYRRVSLSGALAKLEDLRQQVPDFPVDALIGHINYRSLKYTAAMEAFARVPESKMTEQDYVEYALSGYWCKKYNETVEVIKQGLQKSPNDASLNRLAMLCLVEAKNYKEAVKYGDILLNKINKEDVTISATDRLNFGRALAGDEQYDAALAQYEEGLNMKADDEKSKGDFFYYMSEVYKFKKEYPKAMELYEKYLNGQEEVSATDYAEMGTLYRQYASTLQGDEQVDYFQKADNWYAGMLEKYPNTEEFVTFNRARMNAAINPQNNEGRAKPFCEKLIELISSHDTISDTDKSRLDFAYSYLLRHYLTGKDYPNALTIAQKLHELKPEDESVNKAIDELSKVVK